MPESNDDEAGRDLIDEDKDNSKAVEEFFPVPSTSKRQFSSITVPVKKRGRYFGDIAKAIVKNTVSN